MMKKIIMMGPMYPAIGGMATVLENLSKSILVDEFNILFWNTAKETSENRSFITAVKKRLSILIGFYKKIKEYKPDYIHIHTCSGFITFFLDSCFALISRLLGIPYIMHIHGATFDSFLKSQSKLKLKFIMNVLNNSKKVVALTDEWKNIFENEFGLKNVTVILNGVPPVEFIRQPSDKCTGILYMGQVCSRKGTKDLIRAFCEAKLNDIKLHLAGDFGGDVTKEELENYITTFGASGENIIVEGPVQGTKKIKLMEECSVFCLPSYAEGLPMVVLEAMSYRQAVITTDVGGLPGLISNQINGILIQPGDIRSLSNSLEFLVYNNDLRNALSINGYETFLSKYSINAVSKFYTELYER